MRKIPGGERIQAGIDEAGLGPLLGPLMLGYSVFEVSEGRGSLWKRLAQAVTEEPKGDAQRVMVADSKKTFSRNPRGFKRLETTALAFLAQRPDVGGAPDSGLELLNCVPEEMRPNPAILARHPWYKRLPDRLPLWVEPAVLEQHVERLRKVLSNRGIRVMEAGLRAVPAGELNESYARTENKAVTLWHKARAFIEHLWWRYGMQGVDLTVDRMGGRIHYAGLLEELFPLTTVDVVRESADLCQYDLRTAERHMRVVFAVKGDQRSFPVALASCLAKYGRETVMGAFNLFFGELQDGLKPTAGYRTDGWRWMEDAGQALRLAAVDPDVLTRSR